MNIGGLLAWNLYTEMQSKYGSAVAKIPLGILGKIHHQPIWNAKEV